MSTSWDGEISNEDDWSDCILIDEGDLPDFQDTQHVDRRADNAAPSNDFLQTILASEAWNGCNHPADFLCLIFSSFDISNDLCYLLSDEILEFLGIKISETYCFACLKWKLHTEFSEMKKLMINTYRCSQCFLSNRRPVTIKKGIYHEECCKCHQLTRIQDLAMGLCVGCFYHKCISCKKMEHLPMFEYGDECLLCIKSQLVNQLEHEEPKEVQWLRPEISRIEQLIERNTLLRCISCKKLKKLPMFENGDLCLSCLKIQLVKQLKNEEPQEVQLLNTEISRINKIIKLNAHEEYV